MRTRNSANGLETYRIGPKIRALRQARGLGLVELGEQSTLSSGMLSRIERGQLVPTLPTLMKIAVAFGVGLEHFFADAARPPALAVLRMKDRPRLPERAGADQPAYYVERFDFPVADRRMEAYFASFPVGADASEPHSHQGAELVYVVHGTITIDVGGSVSKLGAGDAMYFDASVPHAYRQEGAAAASAIVVVAPA